MIVLATTAFATAAFSDTSIDRQAKVEVVADEAGLIALIDGHPGTGLVEDTGAGSLTIDLTRGGASGTNADAHFELGAETESNVVDDHAFRIVNQGTSTVDVTVKYVLDSSGTADGAESLTVSLYHDAEGDGTIDANASVTENTDSNTTTITGVAPGDVIYVSLTIDTTGLSDSADLSGDLRIAAEPT